MRNRRTQNGFSLIELVLVIMLVSMLSVFATRFMAQAMNAYIMVQNVTDSTWQARLAYSRMMRDLRQIRSPTDLTIFTNTECSFTDMTGASFDYVFTGSQLTLNGQVLADGTSGGFSYYDKNIATATIAANVFYVSFTITDNQKGASFNVIGTASVRDLSL
jgi:prepilin-type N-terminal cleavage/methylation domain-containing protein